MKPTRTRFAPSPTGALHSGTVRTALYAWLVAKQAKGQFILRIEDTDQAREVKGAVKNITDSMQYLGIEWDEGPGKDKGDGPFFQSQRLEIYKEWAEKLVKSGRAYADNMSKENLERLRDEAKLNKKPFLFRNHRPKNPPEWDGKMPLRFKSEPKSYHWNDLVMGESSAGEEAVDDFILIKSDGFPTYNFGHIVDDSLMGITIVIRSHEFIASIPRFLNLYEALDITPPILATVPPVLNIDNGRKLSKREGAKQILEYKKMGILPAAMTNFLALLGWNDETDKEFYSSAELIEKFDLSKVQKSGARFDEARLFWMNGHYIRQTPLDDLTVLVKDHWPKSASNYDDKYKSVVLDLVQERMKYFDELPELTNFFFEDLPVNLELIKANKKLSKLDSAELVKLLTSSRDALSKTDFSNESLETALNQLLEQTNQSPAILFSLIRIATTQSPASPELAKTLHTLGEEISLRRINQTIAALA